MKLVEVRQKLSTFNLPAFTLQDIIGIFDIQKSHASHLMARLVEAGSIVKIKRGIWAWSESDPLTLIPYLTAPSPSYLSLQSALFYNGIIEQIPTYYYAMTIGRSQKIQTALGTFSLHHLHPTFFTGFDTYHHPFYQIACAEKALLDYFYLSRVEPAIFGKLPEVDISLLNKDKMQDLLSLIKNPGTYTYLKAKIDQIYSFTL